MSFGKKKSAPAPAAPVSKPTVTDNSSVPDDAEGRVPDRAAAPAATQPLLQPAKKPQQQGILG